MKTRLFVLLSVVAIALAPILSAPRLSAHSPVLSPVSHDAPPAPGSSVPFAAPLVMGPSIKVKDPGSVAAKWKTRSTAAQGDYGTAVAGAGADWEAGAAAAEDTYGQATAQAIADKRYGRGVRGAAAKYQRNASTLGPQRFAQGVANGQDAMASGIAPVLQTLASINLPPRGVKGSNAERANIVATRLRAMKLGKAS